MSWTLITLDTATCTGWTDGDWSRLPDHGFLDLPAVIDGDRGPAFTALRNWLVSRITRHQIAGRRVILAFEQPILPRAFLKGGRIIYPTNIGTTLLLQGLVAIVEQVCDEMGVECGYVDVGSVKVALAGDGAADKDAMVRVAKRMGFTIERHDTADAVGIAMAALPNIDRRRADHWVGKAWTGRGALL